MVDKWDIVPCFPPPKNPMDKELEKEVYEKWLLERPGQVKKRIQFLWSTLELFGVDRKKIGKTCVYLMWCPSFGVYKIGHTDCLWRRVEEHRRCLDPKIELRVSY